MRTRLPALHAGWAAPLTPAGLPYDRVMTDRDSLLATIRDGEDSELELKEVVFRGGRVAFGGKKRRASSEMAEVFVSMANTSGGLVVLGVRDADRAIVGIDPDHRDALEQFVVNVATENCEPVIVPDLRWRHLPDADGEERLCLVVRVPQSRYEVHRTNEGRHLERVGTHRHLMSGDRLSRLLVLRGLTTPVEEWPAKRCRMEHLDRERLRSYFRGRFPGRSPSRDWTAGLARHKIIVETEAGPVPTVVGALMFGQRPEEVLPSAFIDLVSYRHEDPDGNSADSRRITGPLPRQIADAVSYLQLSPLNPTVSVKRDDGRHDYPAYSVRALQEAVVNAVVHRDYAAPSQIIVRLFPDRIEFRNPGGLFNGLTTSDLYEGCMPRRRNANIAWFLRSYESEATGSAFMESRGEGFMNLVRDSERLSGRRPEIKVIGDITQLTIYAAPPPARSGTSAGFSPS